MCKEFEIAFLHERHYAGRTSLQFKSGLGPVEIINIVKNDIYDNLDRCDLFLYFAKIVEHKCVEDPQQEMLKYGPFQNLQ
jgi:hypothetical protein